MSAANPGRRRHHHLVVANEGNGRPLGGGYIRRGPLGLTPEEERADARSAYQRANPRGIARANPTTTVGKSQ